MPRYLDGVQAVQLHDGGLQSRQRRRSQPRHFCQWSLKGIHHRRDVGLPVLGGHHRAVVRREHGPLEAHTPRSDQRCAR